MGHDIHILELGPIDEINKNLHFRLQEQLAAQYACSMRSKAKSNIYVYDHPQDVFNELCKRMTFASSDLISVDDVDIVILLADHMVIGFSDMCDIAAKIFPYALTISPTYGSGLCLRVSEENICNDLMDSITPLLLQSLCQWRVYLDLMLSDYERKNMVNRIVERSRQHTCENYCDFIISGLSILKNELRRHLQLSKTDALTHTESRIALEEQEIDLDDLIVIVVDVNNLKEVNDTRGHLAGDQVLSDVASRLSRCVRRVDRVIRYGGDEFVLLIRGVHAVESIVQRLNQNVPDVTIGYCVSDGTYNSLAEMINIADQNMYAMKRRL